MRDDAKQITQVGKGDESASLYARHIRDELARRQS